MGKSGFSTGTARSITASMFSNTKFLGMGACANTIEPNGTCSMAMYYKLSLSAADWSEGHFTEPGDITDGGYKDSVLHFDDVDVTGSGGNVGRNLERQAFGVTTTPTWAQTLKSVYLSAYHPGDTGYYEYKDEWVDARVGAGSPTTLQFYGTHESADRTMLRAVDKSIVGNGNTSITGYTIQLSSDGGGTYTAVETVVSVDYGNRRIHTQYAMDAGNWTTVKINFSRVNNFTYPHLGLTAGRLYFLWDGQTSTNQEMARRACAMFKNGDAVYDQGAGRHAIDASAHLVTTDSFYISGTSGAITGTSWSRYQLFDAMNAHLLGGDLNEVVSGIVRNTTFVFDPGDFQFSIIL